MSITNTEEKLEYKAWVNKDCDPINEVPNLYYHYEANLYPQIVMVPGQEMSDQEIMTLPEKIGIFSFLSDDEEDIYTKDDGTPLQ